MPLDANLDLLPYDPSNAMTRIRTVTARPYLNVRQHPSLTAPILGKLRTGEKIAVVGLDIQDKYTWLAFQFENIIAYVVKKWTTAFRFECWPTDSRLVNQSNLFGARPLYYGQWGLPGHEGIDIDIEHGDPIYAPADGIVYYIRENPMGHNYGIHLRIEHIDNHKTIFAHCMDIVDSIKVGSFVGARDIIAYGDNTGNSSGDHLHFTLKAPYAPYNWPGDQIDPLPYLEEIDS